MKHYGVWCEFKDGRKNGVWAGHFHQEDADKVCEQVRQIFPHWTFEVREYYEER